MRYILLLLSFCCLLACNSNKKLKPEENTNTEGIVRYAIALDLNENAKAMEESFGKAAIATFDKNYLRFQKDQQLELGSFQMVNLSTGEEINYLEVNNKKFGVKTPKDRIPTIGEFSFHKEYKNIAGYRCQKATAPMGDGLMTVYFTKEIAVNFCPYVDFEGFALEYSLQMHYGIVKYSATMVDLKTVDKSLVAAPQGYKIISAQELENEIIGTPPPKGVQAKDFNLPDLSGNQINLNALKGKVVLINFWFTECAPCRIEIPGLNQLKAIYKEEDVEFLAISFDPPAKIEAFLKNTPFDFKIIPDAHKIIKEYDIFVYPTSLVIDQYGNIIDTKMGGSSKIMEELKTVIDQALKK